MGYGLCNLRNHMCAFRYVGFIYNEGEHSPIPWTQSGMHWFGLIFSLKSRGL